MSNIKLLTAALKKAERMDQLQKEIEALLAQVRQPSSVTGLLNMKRRARKKRNLSPEAREKIAAAQRARWARVKVKAKKKSG